MTEPLNNLLKATGLWRASRIDCEFKRHPSSGFAELDAELPGSGWPADGVTELLHDQYGIGEFRLLTPSLARLSQLQARWLLLVSPPYIPYPPALAQAGVDLSRIVISQPKSPRDYLWVLENALASKSCSTVIAWPRRILDKQIRRLQVASRTGNTWCILFRPEAAGINASPAELRLRLRPGQPRHDNSALEVRVLKRFGGWESGDIRLTFADQLHRPMPDFSEMLVRQVEAVPLESMAVPDTVPVDRRTYEYQ